MTEILGTQTPPQGNSAGEQTPQNTPDYQAQLADAVKKNAELEAQKEHWRTKYERDVAAPPLTPVPSEEEIFSDEGKVLKNQVDSLQQRINQMEEEKALASLHAQYPVLKDKAEEFNTFKADYPRHKIENVAKLFLVEQGLMSTERKGLEPAGGGTRQVPQAKLSIEDVARLRNESPRKYQQMVLDGRIRPEDIG